MVDMKSGYGATVQPTFLVFGLGAIGSYVGASLALAGNRVIFVERPEVADFVRGRGISLTIGRTQKHIDKVEVVTSVGEALACGSLTAAVLAVKSFDTPSVIEAIEPWANSFPPLVCLQNGVENEIALRRLLPGIQVISGTVTTAVGREAAGAVRVEKLRGIGISSTYPIASHLVRIFNHAGLRARLFEHEQGMKWSKMLTNLLANASSAILDMKPAQIYAHPGLFQVEMRMLKEALTLMRANGYPVMDLPATPIRALVWAAEILPLPISRAILTQALGKGRGNKMPSFHIDLHSGRGRSEVDALNGAVVRFGLSAGLSTPVNYWLTRVLRLLSEGKLPLGALAHKPDMYLEWLARDLPLE